MKRRDEDITSLRGGVVVTMLQSGGEPVHVPMSLRARTAAQAGSLTYTCTNEPVGRGPLCRRSD